MKLNAIVLFDGECLFCNKSVHFIMKHDPNAYFSFASLQSSPGKNLKEHYNIPESLDSLILIENNRYYDASTAALRICKKLNGIYKLGALFLVVPKPLRDAAYHIISRRRHQIRKQESCPIPTPEEKKRHLNS